MVFLDYDVRPLGVSGHEHDPFEIEYFLEGPYLLERPYLCAVCTTNERRLIGIMKHQSGVATKLTTVFHDMFVHH